MFNMFKKEKPQKIISKMWDQIVSQLGKSSSQIEEVKSDGDNVVFKFFKENSKNKFFDKEIFIVLTICLTILASVTLFVMQQNSDNARIDRFHRDIINRCIDKGWDVALYKDGQLESCENSDISDNG